MVRAPFVQSIATSAYSPSSPDPSGIVYRAATDDFIIADSEVEETPLYQGSNLFTTARRATTGTGTGATLTFGADEPTGLGYDPAGGRRADRRAVVDDGQDRRRATQVVRLRVRYR